MAALREGWLDVSVEREELDVDGLLVPVVHARPDGMPDAGLVLHPDIMGIRPLFDDMARRLATNGLAVCVVEPFAARSEADRTATAAAERMAWLAELDDAEQIALLEAAADRLVVADDVARVSVLGFCMGGMYTLKAAACGRFDSAVAFYGMVKVPAAWRGPGQRDALDTAADACPTLAVFGSADPWTPPEDIDALRACWKSRRDCEVVVVEGAEHGFVHDPERPAHRAADAAALWERAIALVKG